MADRSYLYSTDELPDPTAVRTKPIVGISESRYDIPIVYKILLSGAPRACKSAIWQDSGFDLAIAGDYAPGVDRLKTFLRHIQSPEAQPLVDETTSFLDDPCNKKCYFLLECGEIFGLDDRTHPSDSNAKLLREIESLDLEKLIRTLPARLGKTEKKPNFLQKLLGSGSAQAKRGPDPLKPYYDLGLGGWNNLLYFDFESA